MNKFQEKYKYFKNAVARLCEAVSEYSENQNSVLRDGAIQRFEFCAELSWKTIREYLLEQGYSELNSPKSVMKTAFRADLISDEAVWLDILDSRNLTSHLYDESVAEKIYTKISTIYINTFQALIKRLGAE